MVVWSSYPRHHGLCRCLFVRWIVAVSELCHGYSGSSCYFMPNLQLKNSIARSNCYDRGGKLALAVIHNAEENAVVQKIAKG